MFLISFNFLRKRKNDPRLKIIVTSVAFLVSILFRFFLRFDRNRHGGDAHCYIRSDISCKLNVYVNSLYNL